MVDYTFPVETYIPLTSVSGPSLSVLKEMTTATKDFGFSLSSTYMTNFKVMHDAIFDRMAAEVGESLTGYLLLWGGGTDSPWSMRLFAGSLSAWYTAGVRYMKVSSLSYESGVVQFYDSSYTEVNAPSLNWQLYIIANSDLSSYTILRLSTGANFNRLSFCKVGIFLNSFYGIALQPSTYRTPSSATLLIYYGVLFILGNRFTPSASATVAGGPYYYTGSAITPTVTVVDDTTQATLVENTDYTVAYSDNINVGTARVIVTGIGSYSGSIVLTFTIARPSGTIAACTITYTYDWEYTGSAVTPPVQLTFSTGAGTYPLTQDTDYTLAYQDNINVGFGKIIVTGIGTFSGTQILIFRIYNSSDPYYDGGQSDEGGGDGDFDDDSDDVGFSTLPSTGALNAKFITAWCPTESQLNSLASFFWDASFLATIKQWLNDPMDVILGLQLVPCAVSYTTAEPVLGTVATGITMNKSTEQYVTVDCGQITINRYYGSYLDYSPYTLIHLYLPFVGFVDLNPDDVIGNPIRIHYNIDTIGGDFTAEVRVTYTNLTTQSTFESVLYTYSGNCAQQIPFTHESWVSSLKQTFSTVAGLFAGVGSGVLSSNAAVGAATTGAIASIVAGNKRDYSHGGSTSGPAGFLGQRKPFVIIERPNACLPASQNAYEGYPNYVTTALSGLTGLTKVAYIDLQHVPATQQEIEEIDDLLREGVYI